MSKPGKNDLAPKPEPQKCPTGIKGFDEITLLCAGTGTGKTQLGLDFLLSGASHFDEPGVCMSFRSQPAASRGPA